MIREASFYVSYTYVRRHFWRTIRHRDGNQTLIGGSLEDNGDVMDAELRGNAAQLDGEPLGRFWPAGGGGNPRILRLSAL